MKVSLNWIKEFTDVSLDVDELVAKIGAQLGEVEEVINLGERYDGIVVAKVISCEKHPNADKLNVCKIDDGQKAANIARDEDGLVQVVCGAPNVRKGITVAWIPPGAIVPSTFETEKFTLSSRELRGVMSNGMLASGKELAINDDHDGILILDKPAEPGTLLKEVYKLDDYIIDIENKMFTHRPDCFGQLGVAREVAGISGQALTSPDWYTEALDAFKVTADTKLQLEVKNELPEHVSRFMAIPMSGITVTKSPVMIQSFLYRVGIKPINNIVDITNFVMSLTAQPMHAYDYDKVAALDSSDTATLVIRKPKKGEKIALLNGKTIEPREEAIMIASKSHLIGVGGVMGGSSTEVDFSTKNIILECASFDMYSIRRTSMAHGLFTDAVTRFNKGQSNLQNDKVLAYAIAWVQKLAHGHVAGKLADPSPKLRKQKSILTTAEFINSRLGTNLDAKEIKKLLLNVEFQVTGTDKLEVTAPFWRTDIEIAEDIVEEVGRLQGYDALPIDLPRRTTSPAKRNIRSVLKAAGANEVLTYSFVHSKLFEAVGQDTKLAYQLSNALSPELQYYRLSLVPSLLEKVHANIKAGHSEFGLFEINKSHDKSNIHEDGLPIEEERVAFVFTADIKAQVQYAGSAYYQARMYVQELLAGFGLHNPVFEPSTTHELQTQTGKQMIVPFERGRTAYVKTHDGKLLGVVGEIKPEVKANLKLPEYTAAFELDVQMLEAYAKKPAYKQLSRFPHTQQDITFKVVDNVLFSEVENHLLKALTDAGSEHGYTTTLEPRDIYSPEKSKTKNITLRLTLSHPDRTLTTVEVNKLLDNLATVAKKELSAIRI
jgi:phenylalanyl-tRNA synthetase beta chain